LQNRVAFATELLPPSGIADSLGPEQPLENIIFIQDQQIQEWS
jgi:hypothetical protein